MNLEIIDLESEDTINAELKRRMEEKIEISSYDVAASMYLKDFGENQTMDHQSIVLKDVQLLTGQQIISVDSFVLFADQIVGIVAGKIDLNQISR